MIPVPVKTTILCNIMFYHQYCKIYRKVEYVQRRVCFINVQLSLHENVVFSVCARMNNAAYFISIMWSSISGLDAWYHFWFNINSGNF